MVVVASTWVQIGWSLAAVVALHLASRTGAGSAFGALRPFRFLLLFTLVLQAGFTGGAPLLPGLLPGAITREGCAAAAQAVLRLAGVIAASAHLVGTASPLELARSLGWFLAPTARLGVPVREVTLVMALGFHFFPVLLDESRQVRAALESRGISLRHPRARLRARALLSWTLAVLFGMVDRSTRLAAALEARGFALPRRPPQRFPRWRAESTVLVTLTIAAVLVAVATI
jgi:energy-coupling factor transport system permease protein